jgi:hypothetical protein
MMFEYLAFAGCFFLGYLIGCSEGRKKATLEQMEIAKQIEATRMWTESLKNFNNMGDKNV